MRIHNEWLITNITYITYIEGCGLRWEDIALGHKATSPRHRIPQHLILLHTTWHYTEFGNLDEHFVVVTFQILLLRSCSLNYHPATFWQNKHAYISVRFMFCSLIVIHYYKTVVGSQDCIFMTLINNYKMLNCSLQIHHDLQLSNTRTSH